MPHSRLALVPRVRERQDGVERRRYFDFQVDGRSLHDVLDAGDLVGCLGWWPPRAEAEHLEALKGRAPPDSPSGRVSLYVCPACGGLACGAITVRIARDGDDLVWSDFCWENGYDPAADRPITGVGPFRFARAAYRRVLDQRLLEL